LGPPARILSLSLPTSRDKLAGQPRSEFAKIPAHTQRTENILAVICKLAQPKIENFCVPPKNTHNGMEKKKIKMRAEHKMAIVVQKGRVRTTHRPVFGLNAFLVRLIGFWH